MHHQTQAPAVTPEALTPRELEILRRIALGETNPYIATALSRSVKTVEWHRTNLMKKLNLHNVAGLVRYALRYGVVKDDDE
jgi:DNA-binding NarL/FixJ family response regulator